MTLLWHVQSRIFLQCMENSFVMQVMENPMRSVLLDLVVIYKDLVSFVKTGGSLGCGYHEIVVFGILHERNSATSSIATPNFRRNKGLFGGTSWVRAL